MSGPWEAYRKPTPAKIGPWEAYRRPAKRQRAVPRNITDQVFANLAVNDELEGAAAFLDQGARNLVRRAQGKPVERSAGAAYGDAVAEEKAAAQRFRDEKPLQNAFASAAGFPVFAPARGAAIVTAPLRVGATGAGINAPFAFARQEGNVAERLPGAAAETALNFGLGAGAQTGVNALGRKAAQLAANPSPQRRLSRQGVELTPGQMMGGAFQRVEDAMTNIPFVGDAIRGARVRGIESFDRAATNRALAPIREQLPATTNVGREGVTEATQRISASYDRALGSVTVVPDQQLSTELSAAVLKPNLPPAISDDLRAIVQNTMASRITGPIDGPTWKAIDSEIGAMIRAADNASGSNPISRYLRDGLIDIRKAWQANLSRADAGVAQAVKEADEATANLTRIRQASQYTGTSARGGVFSPADLNRAVQGMDTSAGNRAFAQGDALMQDLTDDAMRVLPQTVPNSGTPFQSIVNGGALTGGGLVVGVEPATLATAATGAAAVSAVYSAPVQRLINMAYRARDPATSRGILLRLEQMAVQSPELKGEIAHALNGLQTARPAAPATSRP